MLDSRAGQIYIKPFIAYFFLFKLFITSFVPFATPSFLYLTLLLPFFFLSFVNVFLFLPFFYTHTACIPSFSSLILFYFLLLFVFIILYVVSQSSVFLFPLYSSVISSSSSFTHVSLHFSLFLIAFYSWKETSSITTCKVVSMGKVHGVPCHRSPRKQLKLWSATFVIYMLRSARLTSCQGQSPYRASPWALDPR